MKKLIIKVSGKSKLDDYRQEVESQFPVGSFVLDKKLTGCGATTMVLRDGYYTIVCSPRLELMHCKANDPEFIGLIHEFRKADDRTSSVFDLQNQMMDYIRQMELKYNNPFTKPEEYKAPKILVSYDSFKHVAERLEQEGILGKFRIVVDEFQTLMTDAAFKGDVEIEFLQNLSYSNQIIFLSATPYLEKYLDQITLFQQLPLVELEWPKEAYKTANIQKLPYYRQSITKTLNRIISKYQVEHYFEVKVVNGHEVFATEAVFFLNDVQRIIAVVKQNGLTPDNTNIICARTDENIKRIENIRDDEGVRIGFTVGHVPKEGEPNKTFTFVTKCAFEGVDFYSTCAYTYIFSDITLKHLGLDISIDVPQIMGRQRDDSNPFRYDATFFYKTSDDYDTLSEPEFQNRVLDKLAITDEWKNTFNTSSPKMQKSMAKKLRRSQEADNCEEDYVVIYDDKIAQKVGIETNYLAMYNEIRAWEIRNTTYISDCQVMSAIDETTMSIADDPDIKLFLSQFPNDFVGQMKLYCDAISARPDLRNMLDYLPQIPIEIKRYYNALGPDVIKSNSYIEARLRRLINTNSTTGLDVAPSVISSNKNNVIQYTLPDDLFDGKKVDIVYGYIPGLRESLRSIDEFGPLFNFILRAGGISTNEEAGALLRVFTGYPVENASQKAKWEADYHILYYLVKYMFTPKKSYVSMSQCIDIYYPSDDEKRKAEKSPSSYAERISGDDAPYIIETLSRLSSVFPRPETPIAD